MKKLIFIISIFLFLTSCEKEALNPYEGTSWSSPKSTLEFYESTFTINYLSDSGEVLISNTGNYSVTNEVATLIFNGSGWAVHSASMSQSVLLLTNLSSSKSYQYERK